MTLPKVDANTTIRPRMAPGKQSKSTKQATRELLAILILSLIVTCFFAFHQTTAMIEHHDQQTTNKVENIDHPLRAVGTEPLEHEEMFHNTLKSCLPQEDKKKCKTFVPEGSGERVALIAPPGDMSHPFFELLEAVIRNVSKKRKAKGRKDDVNIELTHTTHMPPYGYGKTHGWTKIIRVVPYPLLLGTANTLQSSLYPGQSHHDLSIDDMKANLRQQIRYHCRLSHISAHTALWTLTIEDVVETPVEDLVVQIKEFLDLGDDEGEEEENEAEDEDRGLGVAEDDMELPGDISSHFYSMFSYATAMMTYLQSNISGDILKELDDVLLREMRISKNLTAWPCESFWTVGEPPDGTLKVSPIISRVARAISPNCTAPFTSCFVQKDICEAKGDGKCKK